MNPELGKSHLPMLLQEYTRSAIEQHLLYFGNWFIPEVYIQGECASRLTHVVGLRTMLEVRSDDLRLVFEDDKLDLGSSNGSKIDMMVFDGAVRQCGLAARAIVEFKRDANPYFLKKDLQRTYDVSKALSHVTQGIMGIQVLYTICDCEKTARETRDCLVSATLGDPSLPAGKWTLPAQDIEAPRSVMVRDNREIFYAVYISTLEDPGSAT